jgi:hypothetical protein
MLGGLTNWLRKKLEGDRPSAPQLAPAPQPQAGVSLYPTNPPEYAVQPRRFAAPYRPVVQPTQQPAAPSPQNTPTSVGRVWGTAVANNAANEQQFSPMFKNIVMSAKPYVGMGNSALSLPGAGGEYHPDTNQIFLRSQQLDPYTVTHEGLHAAYQRKTPQAQQGFFDQVASTATQQQQKMVDHFLDLPLYTAANNAAAHGDTYSTDTEIHSFLPMFGSPTPAQKQYYQHYFTNPDFFSESAARTKINPTVFPRRRSPQFSDWMGDEGA